MEYRELVNKSQQNEAKEKEDARIALINRATAISSMQPSDSSPIPTPAAAAPTPVLPTPAPAPTPSPAPAAAATSTPSTISHTGSGSGLGRLASSLNPAGSSDLARPPPVPPKVRTHSHHIKRRQWLNSYSDVIIIHSFTHSHQDTTVNFKR